MGTLGSDLKLRELLSARLGDVLSNLYLTSMVLKNWHEGQAVEGERDLMAYSCEFLLNRAEKALDELLHNLPNRTVAGALRVITMPLGKRWHAPSDKLTQSIARAISTDSALRAKITSNTWNQLEKKGEPFNALAHYNQLLADFPRADKLYKTLDKAHAKGELPAEALHPEQKFEAGLEAGLISEDDAKFMREYESEVLEMLTVDDFPFDGLAHNKRKVVKHNVL